MYVRLCSLQNSFRARLTPKPWRCNFAPPPVQFPFETPQAERAFRQWEQEYNRQAAGFATCQFVAAFGHRGDDPAFYDLLVYHDQQTRAGVYMPLA